MNLDVENSGDACNDFNSGTLRSYLYLPSIEQVGLCSCTTRVDRMYTRT